jgi:hypothetical protein
MSEILVNTIKKADGTGSITVPADTGNLITSASDISGLTGIPAVGSQIITVKPSADSGAISNASTTVTNFDTVEYDPDNLWDTTNYDYTVPSGAAGVYLIGANIILYSSNNKLEGARLYIEINGSQVTRDRLQKPNTGAPFSHISGTPVYVANLSVGDVVRFSTFMNTSDGTASAVFSSNSRAYIVRIA